ncbi:hypothetical protein Scep_025715 [Stephania cephalantha]|uniref:Reverse transcriptase zinc-binding domain-containing protein n=1 Tax=Stephania cephalantha TaxID=152367 RepID=A0AAP0HRU2_9MAGN
MSISSHWCVICRRSGEELDHLFLHCTMAWQLWASLTRELQWIWVMPKTCEVIFDDASWDFRNSRRNVLWKSCSQSIVWGIWQERNARLFKGTFMNHEELWDGIRLNTAKWLSINKEFKQWGLNDLLNNWQPILEGTLR